MTDLVVFRKKLLKFLQGAVRRKHTCINFVYGEIPCLRHKKLFQNLAEKSELANVLQFKIHAE